VVQEMYKRTIRRGEVPGPRLRRRPRMLTKYVPTPVGPVFEISIYGGVEVGDLAQLKTAESQDGGPVRLTILLGDGPE
jgi:hypothetical protein